MLDSATLIDAKGARFQRFEIDEYRPWLDPLHRWYQAEVKGCVYPETKKVYVQSGESYFQARILLGKRAEPTADVCRAVLAELPQL